MPARDASRLPLAGVWGVLAFDFFAVDDFLPGFVVSSFGTGSLVIPRFFEQVSQDQEEAEEAEEALEVELDRGSFFPVSLTIHSGWKEWPQWMQLLKTVPVCLQHTKQHGFSVAFEIQSGQYQSPSGILSIFGLKQ